jgi:hypothetical protein
MLKYGLCKQVPSMFDEKDLVAMFGMFDVTGCVHM